MVISTLNNFSIINVRLIKLRGNNTCRKKEFTKINKNNSNWKKVFHKLM